MPDDRTTTVRRWNATSGAYEYVSVPMPDDLVEVAWREYQDRLGNLTTREESMIERAFRAGSAARLAALEQAAGEDVVEMAMKAYVVAWHAAPKGKQSQCGVEAVLSAIASTLRKQGAAAERERCARIAIQVSGVMSGGRPSDIGDAIATNIIRAGGSGG